MGAQRDNIGMIYSETSHYIFKESLGNSIRMKHFESGKNIVLHEDYLKKYLISGDVYHQEVIVGREDKNDGTLGIRSIFQNISTSEVFTVCFKKQDKVRSQKSINKEIDDKINEFISIIDKTKSQKKGVSEVAKNYIVDIINNPIVKIEEGEDRVLRGYKLQFTSRDGKYNCMDMDISDIRPVNINNIKYLIYKGTKYVVK